MLRSGRRWGSGQDADAVQLLADGSEGGPEDDQVRDIEAALGLEASERPGALHVGERDGIDDAGGEVGADEDERFAVSVRRDHWLVVQRPEDVRAVAHLRRQLLYLCCCGRGVREEAQAERTDSGDVGCQDRHLRTARSGCRLGAAVIRRREVLCGRLALVVDCRRLAEKRSQPRHLGAPSCAFAAAITGRFTPRGAGCLIRFREPEAYPVRVL